VDRVGVNRIRALEVGEDLREGVVEHSRLRANEQPIDAAGRRRRRADVVLRPDGVPGEERSIRVVHFEVRWHLRPRESFGLCCCRHCQCENQNANDLHDVLLYERE
jgi:hypothetical protein